MRSLANRRFGQWTAVDRAPRKRYWNCICDCGTKRAVFEGNLTREESRSCGCALTKTLIKRNTTHGLSRTPEWFAWIEMKKRCLTPTCQSFKNYGGRGISVCPEWSESFPVFLAYVGSRPSNKHSLGRINNDGNYEPGNVRWETRTEQMSNRRSVRFLTINGERIRASIYALQNGINANAFGMRVHMGWDVMKAATEPLHR